MKATEKQQIEFYQGFTSAMSWSTGGQADYSEAPEGYAIDQWPNRQRPNWGWERRDLLNARGYPTKREAIAAAWEHSGEEPPDLESLEGFELAPVTETNVRAHCDKWLADNYALVSLYAETIDPVFMQNGESGFEIAGHDFWLTSAGHGVGFWCRDLGALGDHLTTACDHFRDKHAPYIGDDGLVYVSGMETPDDTPTARTVTLTSSQLADMRALVDIGASDARQAAKLPDYTDSEAADLERLADAAPGLIALLETPATPVDWQVSWHITLDKDDAETPEAAAMVALDYGYRQFRRALGYREDATRPAMVVNGLDVDLEEGAQ